MTDHIEDGGPAFPVHDPGWLEPKTTTESKRAARGMTLHQYYAGQVLQGFCANPAIFSGNDRRGWDLVNCTEDELAQICHRLADAMLKARKS